MGSVHERCGCSSLSGIAQASLLHADAAPVLDLKEELAVRLVHATQWVLQCVLLKLLCKTELLFLANLVGSLVRVNASVLANLKGGGLANAEDCAGERPGELLVPWDLLS